jgi:hypothetical protein
MPLARIITRSVEDSHVLAEGLRARGFDVQTRSPQEIFSEPVDLEITLEECATEDALERATHSPAIHDVCVFIAPGAISENVRPIRVVKMTPLAVADADPIPEEVEPILPLASTASAALPEHASPDTATLELATVSTSIGDLEMQLEPVEDVPAMTHQSEAFMPQKSESSSSAEVREMGSAMGGAQTHLERAEQFQEGTFEPESAIVSELGPGSFQTAVISESVLQESQPIRLVPPARGGDPPRRGFGSYLLRFQRISRQNKFFRAMASIAAILAIAFLLLTASAHRFSPIPAGLRSSQTREPVPFAARPNSQEKIKTAGAAAQAAGKTEPDAGKPPAARQVAASQGRSSLVQAQGVESKVNSASSALRVVTSKPRDRSVSKSDADYVAKDTVVRYTSRSTTPSAPRRK